MSKKLSSFNEEPIIGDTEDCAITGSGVGGIVNSNVKWSTIKSQIKNDFDLTDAEIAQLSNIDTTTISASQWGHLGVADQDVHTTASVTFDNQTITGTLAVTPDGILQLHRTTGTVDSYLEFMENTVTVGRLSGDAGGGGRIYIGADDLGEETPWFSIYASNGFIGLNRSSASIPDRLTVDNGNIRIDNNYSFIMEDTSRAAVGSLKIDGADEMILDNPAGNITMSPTSTFTVDTLTTVNGIVQTDGSGDFSTSVTLPDGTLATTQALGENSTKLATTAYVDATKPILTTPDVSNPPTDAELDAHFGTPAAAGAGFTGYIDDNGGGANFYQLVSDGTNWWIFTASKAV